MDREGEILGKKGMGKVKGDITEKVILTYVKMRGAHW